MKNKQHWKEKVANFQLEMKYHLHVMKFMRKKQKLIYLYKHIYRRECSGRDGCLGDASLKLLNTQHTAALSNYSFYCPKCQSDAEKALERYWDKHEVKMKEPETIKEDVIEKRIHRYQPREKE